MVQVIEQSGWGSNIGKGLGQGISAGIEDILQNKMDTVKSEREQKFKQKQLEARGDQFEASGLPRAWASMGDTVIKELLQQKQKQSQMDQLSQILEGDRMPDEGGGEEQIEVSEEFRETGPKTEKIPTLKQINAVAGIDPNRAALMQKQRETGLTRKTKLEERALAENKKYREGLEGKRSKRPQKSQALNTMERAHKSGDFSSFRNKAADYLGLEFGKTTSAQMVNSAIKTNLMADIEGMTGRPNQFLEKMLSLSYINPQYSKEANDAILEAMKDLHELEGKELEIAEELENSYLERGKEIPRNFQQIVRKKMNKHMTAFEDNLAKKLGDIEEKDAKSQSTLKKVEPGTKITVDILEQIKGRTSSKEEGRKLARKLGYDI